MNKQKKFLLTILAVGISAQLYINFYISNFKFSFAGIVFPIFLFMYDEINPILLGIFSGLSLYIFRVILGGSFPNTDIFWYFPETIFYIVYGTVFFICKNFLVSITSNQMFIISFVSDFLGNLLEVYIRIGDNVFLRESNVIRGLILVAFIRAGIVWLILNSLRYYRMFLMKKEHEERYIKLLWLTSRLKTEIYWMEKNMENIESVMSNAYELFFKINNKEDRESWGNRALDISKDVHEIKKEYGLVVKGIEEVISNKLNDKGIYFHEIERILENSMKTEIKYKKKRIALDFQLGENFYTEKHYYLMSILRNIIMNSIESIENTGKIIFIHEVREKEHLFIIKDNGCGISEEDLDYIFSPGYSTKINYVTGEINRGLGLSLVKNIVEVHLKGNINIFSKIGEGTTFEIFIPITELEVENI
ncbi:ATP-binding protein [Anaerosalibacter massiliensis]|uniref:histidine kinase n=1 Tax=Anaerosalibacter massiliensis TaxID=1347392 RepID=A0A9X2MGN1_9FIRM|nr:ATP-binding protein [Anaerosalibacter massiliensis]MCR2043655.1 ATP-binding protein [Anaerosalibacter massiliensis]